MHLALALARTLFDLACLAALFHVGRLYERERWTKASEPEERPEPSAFPLYVPPPLPCWPDGADWLCSMDAGHYGPHIPARAADEERRS